jgi:dTDP-4-amino-4,6-dideoxygalactose transaminase
MTAIPFTDLAAMSQEIWPDIEADYLASLFNADFVGGSPVETFERDWAAYCGTQHGVGVANGTDALELAMAALGIGPGDEVIVPANTFIGTAAAVVRAGAEPRFADVSEETLLLTPDTLKAAVTPRTRAVIVVHLYGQVPDMDGLMAAADDHGLLVIEDAAQAHGAQWHGRRAGSFGAAGCFSFYPGKNLGAFGDAGAVVTSRPDVAERVRALANHGRVAGSAHYEHIYVGRNSRMDALQAIALSGKLARIDAWNTRRQEIADRYRDELRGTGVRLTGTAPGADNVYHLLVARITDRDRVREELRERGIQTGVHYPVPCHLQPPLRKFADGPVPVAEQAAAEILSLPMFPHLKDKHVDAVCAALASVTNGSRVAATVVGGRAVVPAPAAVPAQAASAAVPAQAASAAVPAQAASAAAALSDPEVRDVA